MAAITTPGPSLPPSPASTTPTGSGTSGSSSSSSGQPLYLSSFSSQTGATALGLSSPRSLGDLEALFAQISSELGETQNQADGFSRAANTSQRATSLLAAARNLLEMVGLSLTIEIETKEIAKQEAIITEKKEELSSLKDQRSSLVSQRDSLQSQVDSKKETRTDIDLDLVGLYAELVLIAPIELGCSGSDSDFCKGVRSDANGIRSDISSKEGRSAELKAEIDALEGQISALNGQITDLDFQILGVEFEIALAEDAKAASTDKRDSAVSLLALLFVFLLPFTIFLANEAKKEAGQDSFALSATDLDLDQVLKDAIDRIAGREIDETERKLVQENIQKDLPAGTGNPSAVIDRAVGFAGSISALQGALKQVLFGDTATTADAADVSGRLRFTV